MNTTYHLGDARRVLRELEPGSVDLIVSSPPFLALRSYLPADHPDKPYEIGSESTPGEFLDVLLDVVEECARVLAPHGSLCFELGDTYAGSGGAGGDYTNDDGLRAGQNVFDGSARRAQADGWPQAKSLCLIPQSFAFALSYGRNPHTGRTIDPWRVRNIVRWWRPNPPVGALGDKWRPATSEITVACKSARRYWDDIATRTEHTVDPATMRGNGGAPGAPNPHGSSCDTPGNPASAPLQDTWRIPTAPYVTPSGLIVPAGGSVHQVRVPVGVGGDGIQRTTSPDCPVHGLPDRSDPTRAHGEHGDDGSTRNERNDGRRAPSPSVDSLPTPLPIGLTDSASVPADRAATRRNTSLNRTAPAHETTPVGSASSGTNPRTGDTPGSPLCAAPHPDTHASNSAADDSLGAPSVQTSAGTAGTESCTCSHWIELTVTSESTSDYATNPDTWKIPTHGFKGSHYATYPPALVEPLVKAMAPPRVCNVCGEPSRRIVSDTDDYAATKERNAGKWPSAMSVAGAHSAKDAERVTRTVETVGWTDCGHDQWRRGVVLDPFAGTGTTLMVAQGHGHDTIGIDLDARNADLARERLGMFLEVVA